MVSVETNVLVRLIIGDDTHQVVQAESFVEAGHLPLGTFDRWLAKLDGTQKL